MSTNIFFRQPLSATLKPFRFATLPRATPRQFHTTPRKFASPGSRPVQGGPARRNDTLSIFPFVIIFFLGTTFFVWTVKQREGFVPKPRHNEPLTPEEFGYTKKTNISKSHSEH